MIQAAKRLGNVEEYYFSKKLAEVRKLDSTDMPVINLGIGSPDLTPSDAAIHALVSSAQQPGNHGYQSYKGIPSFRKAIADFYKRTYHVSLNPEEQILPLMGSKEGILHISLAFLNEGDEVLIPDPGYPTYSSVSKLAGGKCVSYKLREDLNWGIDIAELKQRDLSKVKIMWINYPHMPTGRVASIQELEELVSMARENNFLIVNDNPYSLILNENPVSLLFAKGAEDVALELNSLSKSHNMAGWRIGWVAGKKEYIDLVLRVRSNMDSGMFLGLQHAATEALSNGTEWFENLNNIYKERRTCAHQILDQLGCSYAPDQSGLFVWAKAPESIKSIEKWIDEILYGAKVFISPGFIFGETGDRYIRISLCAPVEKIKVALTRIQKISEKEEMVSESTTHRK